MFFLTWVQIYEIWLWMARQTTRQTDCIDCNMENSIVVRLDVSVQWLTSDQYNLYSASTPMSAGMVSALWWLIKDKKKVMRTASGQVVVVAVQYNEFYFYLLMLALEIHHKPHIQYLNTASTSSLSVHQTAFMHYCSYSVCVILKLWHSYNVFV